jgi:preprotein translocase subunit Sss1|tara:strand:- start:350 stop:454 length:105 start_codon:yes stop_codon:yes gene_type:complete
MGKVLTVVGLVIIGVVAGFLVRLVVPNHLLRRRG